MKKLHLVSILFVVVLVAGLGMYFSSEETCRDGQGSTIYISKERLLKNIESTSVTEIDKYFIPPTISAGYVAQRSTNSCGTAISKVTVDNGTEKEVSQNNFDKFIGDYNSGCSNCLMQLHQSGNSPLFVEEFLSGNSYMLVNNNGTLILKSIEEATGANSGGTDLN